VWLMIFIRLARVVDLPLPVGPVTSTSPRFLSHMSTTAWGMPSSCGRRDEGFRTRAAMASVPRCLKMLMRNLPTPLSE
jgi:hypothetical protein